MFILYYIVVQYLNFPFEHTVGRYQGAQLGVGKLSYRRFQLMHAIALGALQFIIVLPFRGLQGSWIRR